MNDNDPTTCQIHLDAILDGDLSSPEVAAHVASCPDCQAVHATCRAVVAAAPAPGPAELPTPILRARVLTVGRAWAQRRREALLKEQARTAPSPLTTWWQGLSGLQHALAGGLVGAVALLVVIPLWSGLPGFFAGTTSPTARHVPPSALGSAAPSRAQAFDPSAREILVAAGERREVILPGGTRLSARGPARLLPMARGFHLWEGHLRVDVRPDPGHPFQGTTPHAVIAVLGTVFEVDVSGAGTKVSVERGSVQVAESDGRAHTLTAGSSVTVQAVPLTNGTGAATSCFPLDPDSEDAVKVRDPGPASN